MFIDKIIPAVSNQIGIYDRIKAEDKPVAVYGAGQVAEVVGNYLAAHGIAVSAYAVDHNYFQEGSTFNGAPVINYADNREKYAFVLGAGNNKNKVRRFIDEPIGGGQKYVLLDPYGPVEPLDYEYVKERADEFEQTYNLLFDDLSRKTMIAYVNMKVSGDIRHLFPIVQHHKTMYFNELTAIEGKHIMVDCGAFDGDSIKLFVAWNKGEYDAIYALEPDDEKFNELKQYVETEGLHDVELIKKGVWNEDAVLKFKIDDDTGYGGSIDQRGTVQVPVTAIDNVLNGKPATLIKMDIEGAELNALKGAAKTIEKYQPIIAASAYHKAEDLITLPQYLRTLGKYKFYLRKYWIAWEYDLVLYAIPH